MPFIGKAETYYYKTKICTNTERSFELIDSPNYARVT